jgi:hypothetical protein
MCVNRRHGNAQSVQIRNGSTQHIYSAEYFIYSTTRLYNIPAQLNCFALVFFLGGLNETAGNHGRHDPLTQCNIQEKTIPDYIYNSSGFFFLSLVRLGIRPTAVRG